MDCIVLPKALQEDAVKLAHQGSHAGQTGLARRLRYHFYFHGMNELVQKHINDCFDCQLFTDKKCSELLKHHKVPNRCWETVAVDLFGPLPSKKHVVVIQDLASRFPVAKLVQSTSAQKVLPAIGETYDLLGNPENQLSDNGPPFNSKAMQDFANQRSINIQKTPPLHPSANPVETFMKPLGKAMKIARRNHIPEKKAISDLLESYRDTPHPSTGIPPNAMIFRDQPQTHFPRKALSDEDVKEARKRDSAIKEDRTHKLNQSKYKKNSLIEIGDQVLKRNIRKSKFHPYFEPDDYKVIEILGGGSVVKIQRQEDMKVFLRHPDDIKKNTAPMPKMYKPQVQSQESSMEQWRALVMSGKAYEDDYRDSSDETDTDNAIRELPHAPVAADLQPQATPIRAPPNTPVAVDLQPQATPIRVPPNTPQTSPRFPVDAQGGRTPAGRGRGRPRGGRQPPQLAPPPAPPMFDREEMPVLSPAIRRSERVAQRL